MNAESRTGKRFKGVFFAKNHKTRPWGAQLRNGAEKHFGGYHETEELAARAYDEMAKRVFGQFARLNFPA